MMMTPSHAKGAMMNFATTETTNSPEFVNTGESRTLDGGANNSLEEFLYMDPDTGMIVCMIADEDGFRPATAAQEMASMDSFPASWFDNSSDSKSSHESQEPANAVEATSLSGVYSNETEVEHYGQVHEQDKLFLEMFDNYEHSFAAPFSG